jgi:hypothetical protein
VTGSTDASKIVEASGTANHRMREAGATVVSGLPYTFSVYIKAGERTEAYLLGSGQITLSCRVNLTTGAITSGSGTVTDSGNGWWLVETTGTATGSGTAYCWVGLYSGATSYNGDGTSGVYVYAAQLNGGSVRTVYVATTTAARYLMRQEIHPLIGTRGVLGEPQRPNRLLQSILPAGLTSWTLTGASTSVASAYGGADGALAQTFTSAASQNYIVQSFTTVTDTTYIFSVEVEAVSGTIRNDEVIRVAALPSGCSVLGWLVNGVASADSTSVVVGRLSVVIGTATTYTSGGVGCRIGCGCISASTGTVTLSRPQLEDVGTVVAVPTYPTSWIATTTVAVARTTDPRLTHTLSAAEQTALETAGTLFVEFAFTGAGSDSRVASNYTYLVTLHDGTLNNRVMLYTGSSGRMEKFVSSGGTPQWTGQVRTGTDTVPAYQLSRCALAWETNNCNSCLDGDLGTLDSSATPPVGMTTLDVLDSIVASTNNFGLIVTRVKIWTRRLSDTEMQAVTA